MARLISLRLGVLVASLIAAFLVCAFPVEGGTLASGSAHATAPTVTPGFGTATIDGVFSAAEWGSAATRTFPVSLPEGSTTQGMLFVMNDARNVYIAFRILRPTLGRTHMGTWFDNDADGVSTPGQEDGVSFWTDDPRGFVDEFRCQTGWCRDIDYGGQSNGSAAARNDGISSFYEISHPLASGDSSRDMGVLPPSRVGFTAIVEIYDRSDHRTSCLPVCNILDAANFGEIVLASAPPSAPPPPPSPPAPSPAPTKTYKQAPNLPSALRYTGRSVKHVRLGENLYATMTKLGIPRVVSVACWSQKDWPSVFATSHGGASSGETLISGFWLSSMPRWLFISPKQCSDIQGLLDDRALNGQRAYALATALHERVHAEGIRNEARTECYAVQLVYEFARELNFVPTKALRLEALAVRKSRSVAPRGYWNPRLCRDGEKWDLYPRLRNLTY